MKPLVLVRGVCSGVRLIKSLADSGRYEVVLFHSLLKPEFTAVLNVGLLENLTDERVAYATRLAGLIARDNPPDLSSEVFMYPWLTPELRQDLKAQGAFTLPWVLELIESIKWLHRHRPIRVVAVNHDMNVFNMTALRTARALGIPALHVAHGHNAGMVKAGFPSRVQYADVIAVPAAQEAADFPPIGASRRRLAVTGSPEMDVFCSMRQPQARREARRSMGLAADVPVVTYASSYEETNDVATATSAGFNWATFRTFLRAFSQLRQQMPVQLIVKLHPSCPQLARHRQILEEEEVAADFLLDDHFVGPMMNDGASMAASDLLVTFVSSGAMVDAMLVGTPSLWITSDLLRYQSYETSPWILQIDQSEFTADTLRRALVDEGYRSSAMQHFDEASARVDRAFDGKATERVMNLMDRMVEATLDPASRWGRFYHASREALIEEGRMLEHLRTLRTSATSSEKMTPA